MDGYIGFLASLRRSYNNFILDLSKQCKQLVRHHLDAVTSPYSHICYENDLLAGIGSSSNSIYRLNQLPTAAYFDLSEGAAAPQIEMQVTNQENIPPKDQQQTPPGKGTESKEVLKESQMTVPETPSPDQPNDPYVANKKENGNLMEANGRKRHARMVTYGRNSDANRNQTNILFGGNDFGSKSGSSYSNICSISSQYFARMREVLIERNVPSALNSGFLTPW